MCHCFPSFTYACVIYSFFSVPEMKSIERAVDGVPGMRKHLSVSAPTVSSSHPPSSPPVHLILPL
jgi:hypothetical protein